MTLEARTIVTLEARTIVALNARSFVAPKTRSTNWEARWASCHRRRVAGLDAMIVVVRDHQVIDSFVLGTGVATQQLTR